MRLEDVPGQRPAVVGPSGISARILWRKHRDGGTPERAPIRCLSIKKVVFRGALRPAVLPFGPRTRAVPCAGNTYCPVPGILQERAQRCSNSKDIFSTWLSKGTKQLPGGGRNYNSLHFFSLVALVKLSS